MSVGSYQPPDQSDYQNATAHADENPDEGIPINKRFATVSAKPLNIDDVHFPLTI